MMEFIPKFITDIIDDFKIEKVISWLKEIIVFFLKPSRFINNFCLRGTKPKVYQILFYALLNLLIYFVFGAGQTYKEMYRMLIIIFITTIPFLVINLISFSILLRMSFKFWNIFYFIIVSNLLFLLPIFITQHFFFETENFTFSFLANILIVINTFYNLFIIWNAFSVSIFKIALGYLLNIFILNFLSIIIGLSIKDSYSKESSYNSILDEYNHYAEKISDLRGKPDSVMEIIDLKSKTISNFIGYTDKDTVTFYGDLSIKYIRERATKNQKYIDSIIPLLNFKRNKEIFNSLSKHYNYLKIFIAFKPCDTCLVKQVKYQNKETKKIILVENTYEIEKSNFVFLNEYEKKLDDLIKADEYAKSPNYISSALFYPTDWLCYFLNLETSGYVHIQLK